MESIKQTLQFIQTLHQKFDVNFLRLQQYGRQFTDDIFKCIVVRKC